MLEAVSYLQNVVKRCIILYNVFGHWGACSSFPEYRLVVLQQSTMARNCPGAAFVPGGACCISKAE